jgi:hypothetical protein
MSTPPPARIRIHCLDHGRAALAAARDAGRTVTLESPAGAALWQGIGWWRSLVAVLAAEFPDVAFAAVLDCADAPGAALAALRAGITSVRVAAAAPVLARLAAIAEQGSGTVGDTAEDDVLDLLGEPDPRGTCGDRLRAGSTGGEERHGGD